MGTKYTDHDIDVNILAEEDVERCSKAFETLDEDEVGYIQKDDIKTAFEIMGERVSKEDIVKMKNEVVGTDNNTIDYNEFLKVVAFHKMNQRYDDENDFVDAFVAMGGNPDTSGKVDADKLIHVIKEEFDMTIDIVKLIKDVDEDGSGEIEYGEFRSLLSNQAQSKEKMDD